MNCKGRFVNKEKVFYYKTQTHTHIHSISEGTILEVLKRSLNTKAHTHTHILTHMCPLPLTQAAFLQRICFNLQNKSKSRYISASAGPYVFNPLLLFFSLSILSLSVQFSSADSGIKLRQTPGRSCVEIACIT